MKEPKGIEKRRARRRPVLDQFSFYLMIPKHGIQRVRIQDVSDLGIAFDFEVDVMRATGTQLEVKEVFDFRFYINQNVYLPLTARIVRLVEDGLVLRIGAEFEAMHTKGYQGFLAFLTMLDSLLENAKIDPESAGS